MKQTLQEPLTEAAKIICSPDKSVPAIQQQVECFAIAVALYSHFDHIPWPQIEDAVNRGVLLDPTYIPLYQQALIWLSTRTPEATLPKPVDWITEILRVEPEDSQEAADQKAKTYAQTLAFTDQHRVPIDIQATDWPTFKRGLALLVHSSTIHRMGYEVPRTLLCRERPAGNERRLRCSSRQLQPKGRRRPQLSSRSLSLGGKLAI
jgi:hypothetical protein